MQTLIKFDGVTSIEQKTYKENFMKRYELYKLPKYLILCFRVSYFYENIGNNHKITRHLIIFQRFTKNNFYLEKNPTIVNFPVS
jgi:U4/U6.U5 tri-snRNP-associated protein 2